MNAAPIRFDGEVAIVTGAGSGLGRSYAVELASRGAAVVCNDLIGSAAEATAQDITQQGGAAVPEASSVATPAGGDAIVRTAIEAFGSIDIVITNAGQLRNAAFEDMAVEDFQEVLQVHLAGAFDVTQPAYRHMKTAGYGRIVFMSSSAGMFGSPWRRTTQLPRPGSWACATSSHSKVRPTGSRRTPSCRWHTRKSVAPGRRRSRPSSFKRRYRP